MSEARKQLPLLVEQVRRSKKGVTLMRYGKPVASIVPFREDAESDSPFPLRGLPIVMAKDFDEPLREVGAALGGQVDATPSH